MDDNKPGPELPESIKCLIELFPDGNLKIVCPMLPQKLWMCGLMEIVKDVLLHTRPEKDNIVIPKHGIMDFIKGNKRF